jgi:hypothetical protein
MKCDVSCIIIVAYFYNPILKNTMLKPKDNVNL